jgi:hypothetical protein
LGPDWYLRALEALGTERVPMGVVVSVVLSVGSVDAGALIGVAVTPVPAWAAPGEKASSPTTATAPTSAAGTA